MPIIEEHINDKPRIVLLKNGIDVIFENTGKKMSIHELKELIEKKKIYPKDYYFDQSLREKYLKQKKFLEDYDYAVRHEKLFGTIPPAIDPVPDKFKGKILLSDSAKKLGLK